MIFMNERYYVLQEECPKIQMRTVDHSFSGYKSETMRV